MPVGEIILLAIVCASGAASPIPWALEAVEKRRSENCAEKKQRRSNEERECAGEKQDAARGLVEH